MYQYAIGDYMALKEGYRESKNEKLIKKKGIFITDIKLGKGLSPKIISDALVRYFADGIPVRDTIYNCKDINRFLISEKTGNQWNVEYMDKPQQRTNRFYASTNGAYLYKWKYQNDGMTDMAYWSLVSEGKNPNDPVYRNDKVYQNMLADSGVTILNKFDDKPIEERKINYRYYLRETLKIIEELEPRQLALF